MQYLDPYQIEHAKNFKYRYYPPKLVELAPPDNAVAGTGGTDGHGSMGMGAQVTSSSWSGRWIWIVIVTLIMLSSLLIIAVLVTQTKPGGNASSQAGGGGRRR